MNRTISIKKRIQRAFLFAIAILLAVGVTPSRCGAFAADDPPAAAEKAQASECRHVAGDVSIENPVPPTCAAQGSYDEVTRCALCGEIIATNHVIVQIGSVHQPAPPVRENVLNPISHHPGSYDSVTYCDVCGAELQRVHKEYGGCLPVHLPDYMLRRTVSVAPYGGTVVTFADDAYPPILKNVTLPPAYDGVTLAKERFLAGDGSRRTCADGETVCVICGEVLEEAIPHTWDRSKLAKPAGGSLSERITYSCLVCGETFSASTYTGGYTRIGDVDLDGKVTPEDARLTLRCAVGYGNLDKVITESSFRLADVDSNAAIEPADARLILRMAVGLRAA